MDDGNCFCGGLAGADRFAGQEQEEAAAGGQFEAGLDALALCRKGLRFGLAGVKVPGLDAFELGLDGARRGRLNAGIDQEQELAVIEAPPMVKEDAAVGPNVGDDQTGRAKLFWQGSGLDLLPVV